MRACVGVGGGGQGLVFKENCISDINTLAEKGLSECHCVQSGYRHRWKSTMGKPLCVFMKRSGLGQLLTSLYDVRPLLRGK